jgi:hypothetical protein
MGTNVSGEVCQPHEDGKRVILDADAGPRRGGIVAQRGLAQGVGDTPEKRGLARPRITHRHEAALGHRRVEWNRRRPLQVWCVGFPAALAGRVLCHRRRQRDEQIVDRKPVGLPGAHLKTADVDERGACEQGAQILRRIAQWRCLGGTGSSMAP